MLQSCHLCFIKIHIYPFRSGFCLFLPGPPLLVAVIAWIAGMAAGALYALLPSVLVWKFNVSMVITTLMLN